MIFVPACKQLGMTAKKIIGTSVVAVTCATTAGSIAYTQNNVTDIPAAVAIGAVGAATTPIGQRIARGVSGKTLRVWCGVALLACAPTAFMKKEKHESTQDADHIPGDIAETRAGALPRSRSPERRTSSPPRGASAYLDPDRRRWRPRRRPRPRPTRRSSPPSRP